MFYGNGFVISAISSWIQNWHDDEIKLLAVNLVFNPEYLKYLVKIDNDTDKCFYQFEYLNNLNFTVLYYKHPKNYLTFATNKNKYLFELLSDEVKYYKIKIFNI